MKRKISRNETLMCLEKLPTRYSKRGISKQCKPKSVLIHDSIHGLSIHQEAYDFVCTNGCDLLYPTLTALYSN